MKKRSMIRSRAEDILLKRQLESRFEKQKVFLNSLVATKRDGLLVDLGCGNGLAIEYLKELRTDFDFIGIDFSSEMLSEATSRLPKVPLLERDITERTFAAASVDVILLNKAIHEVYSVNREPGVKKLLAEAKRILRPGGIMFIYENVVLSRAMGTMELVTPEAERLFFRFVRDYSISAIKFRKEGKRVRLNRRDALEFLTKFRELNWNSEMAEAHFIYSKHQWRKLFFEAGFKSCKFTSFPDRQILSLEGIKVYFSISDFKHLMVVRK